MYESQFKDFLHAVRTGDNSKIRYLPRDATRPSLFTLHECIYLFICFFKFLFLIIYLFIYLSTYLIAAAVGLPVWSINHLSVPMGLRQEI
jgi:hypothetical protein